MCTYEGGIYLGICISRVYADAQGLLSKASKAPVGATALFEEKHRGEVEWMEKDRRAYVWVRLDVFAWGYIRIAKAWWIDEPTNPGKRSQSINSVSLCSVPKGPLSFFLAPSLSLSVLLTHTCFPWYLHSWLRVYVSYMDVYIHPTYEASIMYAHFVAYPAIL